MLAIYSYVIPGVLSLYVAAQSLYLVNYDKSHEVVGADEYGFIEISTFVFLIFGIAKGLHFLLTQSGSLNRNYRALCVFFLAGMFYFAMEEISWGQHLYGWETTGIFQEYNDQKETNFHNMSSWLDQKPRLLLEIGVLIFGVIVPLFTRNKSKVLNLNNLKTYFLLPGNLIFIAVLTIVIKLPERINDFIFDDLIMTKIRYSEVQEMFFAYFMMLYIITYYDAKRIETQQKVTDKYAMSDSE